MNGCHYLSYHDLFRAMVGRNDMLRLAMDSQDWRILAMVLAYFRASLKRMSVLPSCMNLYSIPATNPPKGVAMR